MLKGMQSYNDLFLPWSEVRKIEILPRMHLVCVTRGWRGGPPLFCTPENFSQVRAYALARAPQARVIEPAPAQP